MATAAKKRVVGKPFQPGQSGNPGGRRPAILSRAIVAKLTPEEADKIAAELIKQATGGDLHAIAMLWERIEGKVPNRNENGQPGDFDLELDDNERQRLRAALQVVRGRRGA